MCIRDSIGTAEVGGEPVPIGTPITAWADGGELLGSTTVVPPDEPIDTSLSDDMFAELASSDALEIIWQYRNNRRDWRFYSPIPELDDFNTYGDAQAGDFVWVYATDEVPFQNMSVYRGWNLISLDETEAVLPTTSDSVYELITATVPGAGGAILSQVPSPGESQIVFSSDRDGNYEIYVMDADGWDMLPNTSGGDGEPKWSPNGSKMAFQSDRNGSPQIYVMNADGSNQMRLINNTDLDGRPDRGP